MIDAWSRTIRKLGEQKHGIDHYEYFLKADNQVYQVKNGNKFTWFCNFPNWENALHKVCNV